MNTSFIVVDLETTGLNPKLDKIIEIGAIRIEDGQIVATFEQLVNPGMHLSEHVEELTGITDKDLERAPYIEDVLPKFIVFAGDLPFIGHKIVFDFSFLKRAAVNQGYTFEKMGVDTLRIARCFLPQEESKKLPDLCQKFVIPHKAHRALSDVEATWALYQQLVQSFYKDDLSDSYKAVFEPVQLIYKVKKDQKASKAQIERLARLHERFGISPEVSLERLSKNEASRLYDKLVSQHAIVGKEV